MSLKNSKGLAISAGEKEVGKLIRKIKEKIKFS
jgi:hypothetical protein